MHNAHITTLDAAAGAPSQFRIFTAGEIRTEKGTFLFDSIAASNVFAAMERRGVSELPIDYGHAMIAPGSQDPALAGRAAGWFKPSLRGGELWADVRWTSAAELAIRSREWRHISPAFLHDVGTKRVTELLNVALTNMPATWDPQELIAASLLVGLSLPGRHALTMGDVRPGVTLTYLGRHSIEIPDAGILKRLDMTAQEYAATQKKMFDEGSLR